MNNIILTEEILDKGKSRNGAWSKAQLKLFGIIEMKKGWKKKIVGLPFSSHIIHRFLNLKDKHLEKLQSDLNTNSTSDNLSVVDQDLPIEEQYRHPEWIALRQIILERDNYACKICKSQNDELHVHHLMYPKDKYVWQIDQKYLIVVCKDCHETIHNRRIYTESKGL